MQEIRSRAAYLELVEEPAAALARAEIVRDLELDLYWRRAAYFWAFSAAAFAGYFGLASATEAKSELLVVASCLGTVFSWAWYLANRGGKYWQTNWEQHIDVLEDIANRPIYKMNLHVAGRARWNPLAAYPWSVSKLNLLLSLFVAIVWGVVAYDAAVGAGIGFQGRPTSASCVVLLSVVAILLMPRVCEKQAQVKPRKFEFDLREFGHEGKSA